MATDQPGVPAATWKAAPEPVATAIPVLIRVPSVSIAGEARMRRRFRRGFELAPRALGWCLITGGVALWGSQSGPERTRRAPETRTPAARSVAGSRTETPAVTLAFTIEPLLESDSAGQAPAGGFFTRASVRSRSGGEAK